MAAVTPQQPTFLPTELSRVSLLVEENPEGFIIGSEEIRSAAVEASKLIFDLGLKSEETARAPIAELVRSLRSATGPQTRAQGRGSSKRKRSLSPPQTNEEIWRPTPLEALHLDGMDDDQLWSQLELRNAPLCDILKKLVVGEQALTDDESTIDDDTNSDSDDDMEGISDIDVGDSEDGAGSAEEEDEDEGEREDGEDLGEDIVQLRDPSSEAESNDGRDEGNTIDLDRPLRPSSKKKNKQSPGHPILDDGFFSLADFNAETEESEALAASKGRLADDSDEDENLEDEIDLFATLDDEAGAFEEEDLEGEPYYKDFFAPPAKKSRSVKLTVKQPPTEKPKTTKVRFHDEVKVKKIKSRGKGVSVKEAMKRILLNDEPEDDEDDEIDEDYAGDEDEDENVLDDEDNDDDGESESEDEDEDEDEEDGEESGKEDQAVHGRDTIDRFKDDLFAEDYEDISKDDRSTFEKLQAEIAAQIVELEAKNVAPKEWMLMGEANSRSRPVNSLLEQDLEFDRIMKPAPVITEESVGSLEDLIKRRILDNKFDDVVRKEVVDDKPFLPSRFFELNDQKSAKSLAQIYEDEYRAEAGGVTTDDRDGKLKKEHQELESMWTNICYKLDALTNAHFTPKMPKATIATVSNIPAATVESTLPTIKSTRTMLAPEEVYSAPRDIRSREELTPNEKRTERNKQKKVRKKVKDRLAIAAKDVSNVRVAKGAAATKREKAKAMKGVVKVGKGVTVVGKPSAHSKRGRGTAPIDSKSLKL